MRKQFFDMSSHTLLFMRGRCAAALLALGSLIFVPCFPTKAQQPTKLHRVGVLSPRLGIEAREEKFRQTLRELGYIEGQN